MLAAVVGGGVTAAALLGAGVVDPGDNVTVIEPPLSPDRSRRRWPRAATAG